MNNDENRTVVYAINGYGDEGHWEIELFSCYEKALAQFRQYVRLFEDLYDVEVEMEYDDWASYDAGNHHDTFWVEELEIH